MKISPIKTKKDYEAAIERIDALMDAKKNTVEADELDVWATLVSAYEEIHHRIDDPDPIAAIEHQMEALGMDSADLAKVLGGRNRVSEVLGKRRPLSMKMVRALHENMGISPRVLIKDYPLRRSGNVRPRRSSSHAS